MCGSGAEYVVRFFFFQAEDGIRDYKVTGVQTCALPISHRAVFADGPVRGRTVLVHGVLGGVSSLAAQLALRDEATVVSTVRRSEERRVGKECRSRWSPYH